MEEKSDSIASRSFKLLQPELMTIEELSEILRGCCVKNDLTSYNKSELVELFKRVALPLPQREYNSNNWRERLLSKGQKRKASSTVERDNVKRICATNGSTKNTNLVLTDTNTTVQTCKSTSSSGTSNPSRLKPPININNYTKKVLKLALPNSKTSDGSSSRKIISNEKTEIKSQEKTVSLPSKKNALKHEGISEEKTNKSIIKSPSDEKQPISNGKHKRIVIDFSDSSTTTTKTPKLVNLKRSNSEVANSGQKIRKIVNI